MEFITTGNRIAVENFAIGKIYTITWETGNYKSLACTGKGTDFVMFQDQEPDLLFCLTMDSAISVSSIEEGGGGSGTNNYNELENKPSINGFVLVGNKTGAELGLASQSDLEDFATNASVVAGLATKQDALSSSQLAAVNSGITSALVNQIGTNTSAIAGKQDALSSSQLAAVNSGITSALVTQIGTNTSAIAGKQDALSSSQLQAVNSGISSADVAQITTNKNNISFYQENGSKNALDCTLKALKALNANGWTDNVCHQNGVYYTVNADGSITVSGTSASGDSYFKLSSGVNIGDCKLTGCPSGGGAQRYMIYVTTPDKADTGSGSTYTGNSGSVYIIVRTAVGAVSDLVFKPMISPADMDNTYQQYAPSNAELYAMIQALQS